MSPYRPQTDDGGESAGSWHLPDAPPPSCLTRGYQQSPGEATQPNDATIRKGSEMSVPGASDTAATDTPNASSAHRFSDSPLALPLPGARGVWYRTTYIVERQGWVKIGVTSDLHTRLTALRARKQSVHLPNYMDPQAPLRVLAVIPRNVETYLHHRYDELRVDGEWFIPDEQMLAEIEALGTPSRAA